MHKLHAIPRSAQPRAQLVVISQPVCERFKAADARQRSLGRRERRSQPKVDAALQPSRGQHARHKVRGYSQRLQPGPQSSARAADVRRRDQPGRVLHERCHHLAQVSRAHTDVAVIHYHVLKPRARHHLCEIRCLAIRAQHQRTLHQPYVHLGILDAQSRNQSNRGVFQRTHAEQQLHLTRIVLHAMTHQPGIHSRIHAAHRLQDRYRRGKAFALLHTARSLFKRACRHQRDQPIRYAAQRQQRSCGLYAKRKGVHLDSVTSKLPYSYRNASIGFKFAAFHAG